MCWASDDCRYFTFYEVKGEPKGSGHCCLKSHYVKKLTNSLNHTAGICEGKPVAGSTQTSVLSERLCESSPTEGAREAQCGTP